MLQGLRSSASSQQFILHAVHVYVFNKGLFILHKPAKLKFLWMIRNENYEFTPKRKDVDFSTFISHGEYGPRCMNHSRLIKLMLNEANLYREKLRRPEA